MQISYEPKTARLAGNEFFSLKAILEEIFARRPFLDWYRSEMSLDHASVGETVNDFVSRSEVSDVTPIRFFDPVWFRSQYRLSGVNAFVSYLKDESLSLARPSPLFDARWYSRRNNLTRSAHPFIHFIGARSASPHPLLNVEYLRKQSKTWRSEAIALEFITDATKFNLDPHPLFDSDWYIKRNPDVVAAGMNPLEHYLQFGHFEERDPNRLFVVRWYKNKYLSPLTRPNNVRKEPLTHYVQFGHLRGCTPLPGLAALRKVSVALTEFGPMPLVKSLDNGGSLHAALRHYPTIEAGTDISRDLPDGIQRYNPQFPGHTVLLPRQRIAIMYSPKCASAKLVYWWLEQSDLLKCALRFTSWSHDFEIFFRSSREYLEGALGFDASKYTCYKFVRHPVGRIVSGFANFLMHPAAFGCGADAKGLSFFEFLEWLKETNFCQQNPHFVPQHTKLEAEGEISPIILKIEEGLDVHLKDIERRHGLSRSRFEEVPEICRTLYGHRLEARNRRGPAGPDRRCRFGRVPHYSSLITKESVHMISDLYRQDLEAYSYQ